MKGSKPRVKVAFAAGSDELNARLIERMRAVFPELPLYVVSEFPPDDGDLRWIRYELGRGYDNLGRCRSELRGKSVRLAGVMLVANSPAPGMRLLALLLAPLYFLAVNENLDDFMLRPRSVPAMLWHVVWRTRNSLFFHFGRHPTRRWRIGWLSAKARLSGWLRTHNRPPRTAPGTLENGTSVILPFTPTADWADKLSEALSGPVEIVRGEESAEPPSAAAALRRGIGRARYSRVLLWNRPTPPNPETMRSLHSAFETLPDLFCASLEFRNLSHAVEPDGPGDIAQDGNGAVYALYGGDCSLYDTAKLRAVGEAATDGCFADIAILELCYRAWRQMWPTVFVPAAAEGGNPAPHDVSTPGKLISLHRYTEYLGFLVRSVSGRAVFRRLWGDATRRLAGAAMGQPAALRLLGQISRIGRGRCTALPGKFEDDSCLALTDGGVSVFTGRAATGKPRVVIASPYLPFPLSHGGAVRMYNLTRRAAADFDQILVAFRDTWEPPAAEILDLFVEIILVRRVGTHAHPKASIPDAVQEFDSAAYRAALRHTVAKWQAPIVQLEFTQMAQYHRECAPARTILVEHDITLDLYRQMAGQNGDWDSRRQYTLWSRFEKRAWAEVDSVVTMSDRDRAMAGAGRAAVLANGVDLERFQKSSGKPDGRRMLFVGSFAHLPNLLAVDFFLREVWPKLSNVRLHVIAGARHRYFLSHYRHRVHVDLDLPGVEVDDFVADVRPAYERAAVVIAPLEVSAGTNLKILEAMALEKPVVSTPAGVNGLDLDPGGDFVRVETAEEMARAIERLMDDPAECARMGAAARRRVEREYNWDEIARRQSLLYRELMRSTDGAPAPAAELERHPSRV